jgi:hypothetical protein
MIIPLGGINWLAYNGDAVFCVRWELNFFNII